MNPTLDEPPAEAARSDTETAIGLCFLYQNVSEKITGTVRWLGNQNKLKAGENRWLWGFKKLVAQLRIWKFDPEHFMRWAISTHEVVIDHPATLASDWLLGKYSRHRERSMADSVKDDKPVRGDLDMIRTSMEADVENLARWRNFMPDYKQRLLNQYQSLSPHFLATDVVFLDLVKANQIEQATVLKVGEVLRQLNGDKWFYQQVRQARDTAIMDAGK